jgi:ABC-type transport system substrate-binding protein
LANRLLDAAGWGRRNRQGIRERSGRAFDFTVVCTFDTSLGHGDAAVCIQAALKRAGVRMNIRVLDEASVDRRVKDGDYEAAIGEVNIYGSGLQVSATGAHLHQPFDAAGYANPKLIELFGRLWRAVELDEVDRVLRDIAALFQQDVPATFLFPAVFTTVASARIRGVEDCYYLGDITGSMDRLWLEGAN